MTGRRVALVCAALLLLAGCSSWPAADLPAASGQPTGPVPPPSAPPTTAPPALPLPPAPPPTTTATSATGFPEGTAASCAGRPGVDRVVALVRAKGILDGTGTVSAPLGPLCAGTWQYTILQIPDREPLQVVSQGPPTALVLVTAGTDVCTDQVRATAPAGILAAAHCG